MDPKLQVRRMLVSLVIGKIPIQQLLLVYQRIVKSTAFILKYICVEEKMKLADTGDDHVSLIVNLVRSQKEINRNELK